MKFNKKKFVFAALTILLVIGIVEVILNILAATSSRVGIQLLPSKQPFLMTALDIDSIPNILGTTAKVSKIPQCQTRRKSLLLGTRKLTPPRSNRTKLGQGDWNQ